MSDRKLTLPGEYGHYDIQYNGGTGKEHLVFLYDYPQISQPAKKYDSYSIPGRDGELIGAGEYKGNLTISCTFSVLHKAFLPVIRDLREWLSGTGNLVLSESSETFYRVLKIEYGDIERDLRNYGRFTVNFLCYPLEFLESGMRELDYNELTYNPYILCKPLYKITGNGTCTLTVNGKSVTATVGQNLTIDTERMLSFRTDGTMNNTALTGDYEDLWLPKGTCSISITSGFGLKVIPRWGYEV